MRIQSRLAVCCIFVVTCHAVARSQDPVNKGIQLPAAQEATQLASPPPVKHSVTFQDNRVGFVPAASLPQHLQKCSSVAPSGYAGSACAVILGRDLPISPPSLSLPAGTTVYIVLNNPHGDENIAFNNVTAFIAPEDLLADALRSLVTPGSSFVAHGVFQPFDLIMNGPPPRKTEKPRDQDPIPSLQEEVLGRLQTVLSDVQDANTTLTCLETYKPVAGPKGKLYCDQTGYLTPDAFDINSDDSVISEAIAVANNAAKEILPVGELTHIDALLKASPCLRKAPSDNCYGEFDQDQSLESLYDAQVTSLQTSQNALLTGVQTLKTLAPMPKQLVFMATLGKNHNSTVTVIGTEIVTKTATTIGTVAINTQATRFVLSSGLLYGSTAYRNYSLTNQFSGGVASTTMQITKTLNQPAIDFPVVMGSIMSRYLSNRAWENRCPNHCAFLFSVGIGANLAAKTADLAGGPSFQIGGFLITPVAIGARQNHLLNGLYVGQTNSGLTASSGITSANHWVPGGGIAITYTIPTP